MSDRELRDEIEVLYGELKATRAMAGAPVAEELAQARTELQHEILELTGRRRALRARLEELERLKADREAETATAKGELAKARASIAQRQPLGNPLAETYSSWEQAGPHGGCAVGVWIFACVGLSALGWWLT